MWLNEQKELVKYDNSIFIYKKMMHVLVSVHNWCSGNVKRVKSEIQISVTPCMSWPCMILYFIDVLRIHPFYLVANNFSKYNFVVMNMIHMPHSVCILFFMHKRSIRFSAIYMNS